MDANDTRSGGPAFPTCVSADGGGGLNRGEPGMSLRDWFAGQALTGMMSCESENFCIIGDDEHTAEENRAILAYKQADAMLRIR